MAIIRPGDTIPRLPEIGRIRKGGPKREKTKTDGTKYQIFGEDLDHFRFDPAESTYNLPAPDGDGRLADYLMRQWDELGEKPRYVPIQFMHNAISENFTMINEVWARVGTVERCVRRCDGETVNLSMTEDKKLTRTPLPCSAVEGLNECPMGCKPTGRLQFLIPQLNYPGLVIMTTHSIYDIYEIQGNLALYQNWELSKIPFQLCRTERTINRNDNGKVTAMKKWLCHLVIDPRFGNAVLGGAQRQYLAELEGEVVPNNPNALPPSKTDRQAIFNRLSAAFKRLGYDQAGKAAILQQNFETTDVEHISDDQLEALAMFLEAKEPVVNA